MNTKENDQYIVLMLNLKELDTKVCKREINMFRCCADIKGKENCDDYLRLIRFCYKNNGRVID